MSDRRRGEQARLLARHPDSSPAASHPCSIGVSSVAQSIHGVHIRCCMHRDQAILAAAARAACERAIGEPLTGGRGWAWDDGVEYKEVKGIREKLSHGLNTD
jgi:hypothetical protein